MAVLLSWGFAAAQTQGPRDPVITLDRGLTKLLSTPTSIPFERRYLDMLPVIDEAFDLDAALQAIVRPNWVSLTAVDRQALLASFRRYTVSSYVVNFSAGNGTVIKLQPGIQAVGDGQLVSTLIAPSTGDPTKVNYVVKQEGQGWQITDVYLDGSISQVAVQRSDFRSLLTAHSAAELIQRLDSKVAELSDGAVKP